MMMQKGWMVMGLTLVGCGVFVLAQQKEAVPPAFEQASGAADPSAPPAAADSTAIDPFDPDVLAPHMIRVQVEFIEVSHDALIKPSL